MGFPRQEFCSGFPLPTSAKKIILKLTVFWGEKRQASEYLLRRNHFSGRDNIIHIPKWITPNMTPKTPRRARLREAFWHQRPGPCISQAPPASLWRLKEGASHTAPQPHWCPGPRGGSNGEESTCNSGDPGSVPGSGQSPGKGNRSPLQYSCLEDPTDRGAWWATVHGVARGRKESDRTKRLALSLSPYQMPGWVWSKAARAGPAGQAVGLWGAPAWLAPS